MTYLDEYRSMLENPNYRAEVAKRIEEHPEQWESGSPPESEPETRIPYDEDGDPLAWYDS